MEDLILFGKCALLVLVLFSLVWAFRTPGCPD